MVTTDGGPVAMPPLEEGVVVITNREVLRMNSLRRRSSCFCASLQECLWCCLSGVLGTTAAISNPISFDDEDDDDDPSSDLRGDVWWKRISADSLRWSLLRALVRPMKGFGDVWKMEDNGEEGSLVGDAW